MTTATKSSFADMTVRCFAAVAIGLCIVAMIALGMFSASMDSGAQAEQTAYVIPFPEDEQMLREMSAQLIRQQEQAAAARTGAYTDSIGTPAGAPAEMAASNFDFSTAINLNDIEPAAGDIQPAKDDSAVFIGIIGRPAAK